MSALLDGAALTAGDDVLVLGAVEPLVFGVRERVGGGWVYAVDESVDALERLLRAAHELGATGVAYLVGGAPVLPLPDASVDAAVAAAVPAGDADAGETARELYRVLRPGGRASIESPPALTEAALAAALRDAGFDGPAGVPGRDGRPVVSARRP